MINFYKNRIKIRNPIIIFGGLTISEIILRHISKRRNEIIADIFNRAHLGKRKGREISLILEKEPDAKFEQLADIFITTFNRKEKLTSQSGGVNGGINEGVKSLLILIKKNPGLRIPVLSKKLKKPGRTIEKWLIKLKKLGKIQYKGSLKTGGHYVK